MQAKQGCLELSTLFLQSPRNSNIDGGLLAGSAAAPG